MSEHTDSDGAVPTRKAEEAANDYAYKKGYPSAEYSSELHKAFMAGVSFMSECPDHETVEDGGGCFVAGSTTEGNEEGGVQISPAYVELQQAIIRINYMSETLKKIMVRTTQSAVYKIAKSGLDDVTRQSAPDKGETELAKAQERIKELESLLRRAVSCFSYHSESASDLKAEINRYLKP